MRGLIFVFFLLLGIVISPAQTVSILDFETPGQFNTNFRSIPYSGGNYAFQTDNGAANDYVASIYMGSISIYDTNGSAPGINQFSSPFTLSLDIRGSLPQQNFRIMFLDPTNESHALMATFIFDVGGRGPDDEILFGVTNDVPGGNFNDQSGGSFLGDSGYNVGPNFDHIQVTYSVTGTIPVITLAAGSFVRTSTFPAGTAISNPELAVGVFGTMTSVNSADFDNFAIVPEPGTASLLAFAMLVSAIFCWKGRKAPSRGNAAKR